MNKAIEILAGGKDVSYWIICFIFSLFGIIISLYSSSRKRDPLSTNTPFHFSLKFLFWDSQKRIIPTLVVMYVIFRLLPFAKGGEISDANLLFMIGVGVGVTVAFDQLIAALMSTFDGVAKFLSMNRDKYMKKIDDDTK